MTKQEKAEKDYLAGMKYKDIAAKYEVSINTVKSWKKRNGWSRGAPKATKRLHPKQKSVHTKEKVAPSLPVSDLPDSDELNDRQKAFCLYYLQRYNATWAYQKAYGGSYESALAHGPRLVGNGRIKSYLSKLKEQQSKELYVTATDILRSYLHQATSDITDVLSFRTVKHMEFYKIRDKKGPYEDSGGRFRYVPKIDPETGKQAFYYENVIELKDSENIDTSSVKSIRVDKGQPVVEMYDKQRAMNVLLDRLSAKDGKNSGTEKIIFQDDLKPDKENDTDQEGGTNDGTDTKPK